MKIRSNERKENLDKHKNQNNKEKQSVIPVLYDESLMELYKKSRPVILGKAVSGKMFYLKNE